MPTVSPAVAPPRTQTLLRVLALAAVAVFAATFGAPAPAQAQTVRIKDIADFEGVRDNMLVGYGLAVGLNGTATTSLVAAGQPVPSPQLIQGLIDTGSDVTGVSPVALARLQLDGQLLRLFEQAFRAHRRLDGMENGANIDRQLVDEGKVAIAEAAHGSELDDRFRVG